MGMREIKFRAWDKLENSMHDTGCLFWKDSKIYWTYAAGMPYQKPEDYILMQYTGLKDKNGVEIYEGDILGKRPYGYFKKDDTKDGRYKGRVWDSFAVEWGEWGNEYLCLASGYEYENDGKVAGWNITFGHKSSYDDELKNYEVIGNIYENPELLKEQTND